MNTGTKPDAINTNLMNPQIKINGTYRFDDGREVGLMSFELTGTYAGVLEGTPETASKHILDRIELEVKESAGSLLPMVLVPPTGNPLPKYKVVSLFSSRRGVRTTDPDYSSQLSVCSFLDSTDNTIDQIAQSLLSQIDWNASAGDYDIMDF